MPALRDARLQGVEIVRVMHPLEVFPRDWRCFALHEVADHAGGDELILNGVQPVGTFRMVLPHIMQEAVAVSDEGGRHAGNGLGDTWYVTRVRGRKSHGTAHARYQWHVVG